MPIKKNSSINFNNLLNAFEINKEITVLGSVPRNIGIGAHFFCNANCTFCLGGHYPSFTFERYKCFFEEKLKGVLDKAENVDFHGYGELLLMPEINNFLKYVNKTLPEQFKTFFTNGIALKDKNFTGGKYNVIVSLHASNKELHKRIVGVDGFDYIIENIKALTKQKNVNVTLYSVLNTMNINDMCDFVKLAAKLKVNNVVFRYLTVFEPRHFGLSVFTGKENANKNIIKAASLSKKLGIPVKMPEMFFNGGKTGAMCMQPWNYCYIETQGTVNPCCYADKNIGSLNNTSFAELWNSKKYVMLRKNIIEGKPCNACSKCVENNPRNVDKISSHITFRPSVHKKMLKYIAENKEKYSLSEKDIV